MNRILLLLFSMSACSSMAADKPNVLFMIVDDMNWRLGCYGNEIGHTPNLDRLAKRGVRFDRAYCNYPVCGASRTSFLSGRYPTTTGVLNNGVDPRLVLGEEYRFLPEYFHDHGYRTVGVGKIPHTPENIDSMSWDFHRDPQWEPEAVFEKVENPKEMRDWPEEEHPDGITTRLAIEALKEKSDKPLFLAVGFHRPHAPRAAPRKYWDLTDPGSLPIPVAGEATKGIPKIAFPPKYEPDYTEDEIRSTLHSYYSTAAFIDAQVGMLLDTLDEENLWEDTIVVFFSDHGVHLGEHGGFWNKTDLMEEAVKVPLLIHIPGGASDKASAEPVELVDLFPTLTDACVLPPQDGVEGESLLPLLQETPREREKSYVFNMVRRDGGDDPMGFSVRSRNWVYTEWPDGSKQLYNHDEDPGELVNLAGEPRVEEIEQRLASQLARFRKRYPLRTPTEQESSAAIPLDRIPPVYRKGGGFEPDGIETFKKAGGLDLKLDIFHPEKWSATDRRPAAIFFFGGGWKNGDTKQFYPQSEYLASRGMVAICAQYRTENEGGATPADCVEDAKSAVRFVRKHAARFDIDPDKIAVGGGSAGGHLAAATATVDGYDSEDDDLSVSPMPNALLLYNPAVDNSEHGYGYERVSEEFPSISPMENLDEDVPPTIIFLGDRDGVFSVERAKLYQQQMEEIGTRCELLIYPDQVHGFFRLDRSKNGFDPEENSKHFLATTEELDRFLGSLGYVSGEPTVREWFAKAEGRRTTDKPNIIVIFADDLGYEDLGVHGSPDAITPNIDSLAANGVRFTDAYVTAPVCSPSRGGLLTGRYQNRFGFEFLVNDESIVKPDKANGIDPDEITIADRMKELGYVTGCVGKWHVGSEEPLLAPQRGFDEFYGTLGQSGYYDPIIYDSREGAKGKKIRRPDYYTTDDYSRRAVEFIREHENEPFFLYLPHFAVHTPHDTREKYLSRFEGVEDEGRRNYLAVLSAMDDGVGLLLDTLRETGLEEDTLIFFLSDNGGTTGSSNRPLQGRKGGTWEGGIRVPFLVQWKSRLPAGTVYEKPVISLDILPTAVAAAGGVVAEDWRLDGVNLLPYLEKKTKGSPHEALYWRFGTQWAIRRGDWKLLQAREGKGGNIQIANVGPPRLFNLAEDIGESNDLAEEKPSLAAELRALWEQWAADLPEPYWVPKPD